MSDPASTPERIVVVGASLAGLRAVEQLRRLGFDNSLVVVGDEPHLPYDRTSLTKSVLTGRVAAGSTQLAVRDDVEAEWVLGVPAVGLDRQDQQVVLADGQRLPYDRVLVSTGMHARPWTVDGAAAAGRVVTLRTRADAEDLQARLTAGPRRIVIIGAGFIGSEVASSCRELGIDVTVVERADAPLQGALGRVVGPRTTALHRSHGVDLRLRTSVTRMSGDLAGGLTRVHLDDGTSVDADVVMAAVGSVGSTAWLEGSGLAVHARGGVACDGTLRVLTDAGVPDDSCYAAGDVAQVPHPVYDDQLLVVEHWGTAVDHGVIAAHNMLARPADRSVVTAVPQFWSNQFGVNIKSVGVPSLADQVVTVHGPTEQREVLVYGRAGVTVAAVAFDAPRELSAYGPLIEERAPFPPAEGLLDWDGGAEPRPVPAGFRAPADTSHEAEAVDPTTPHNVREPGGSWTRARREVHR